MKTVARRIIPIIAILFILGGTGWAQTRVATVDLRKLFDKYYKTDLAQKALKESGADLAKESTTMREDFKKANDEYRKLLADANEAAVTSEVREKRKQEAETKLKELKQSEDGIARFEQQARVTMEEKNRRMRANIIEEIRTVVNARAKSAGYSLVIDSSADAVTGTPVVLYNSGDNDITDAVLTQLNAAAPLETIRPASDKPADKNAK
jgi:outer membrane protein